MTKEKTWNQITEEKTWHIATEEEKWQTSAEKTEMIERSIRDASGMQPRVVGEK